MYRQLNLRTGADAPTGLCESPGDVGLPTNMNEPAGFPDSENNGNWFIFVVGSNVTGQNARGWESEVFKRLYWSHNKSRFVGVSWFGDPYTDADVVYNYHEAVRNAFATAPALARQINGLSGSKTIAGHSLGCGVIAAAITDCGLSVANACFIDAALARECFDGDSAEDLVNMAHPSWMSTENPTQPKYDRSLWASDWHKRFLGGSDARQTLTWNGRFAGAVPFIYNFYSSTEDVLAPYPGLPGSAVLASLRDSGLNGRYAWTVQEKTKGNKISIVPWLVHAGSDYAGWGFNLMDPLFPNDPTWYTIGSSPALDVTRVVKTSTAIGPVTQDLLDGSKRSPLFKTGWGSWSINEPGQVVVDTLTHDGPDWIFDLYRDPSGSAQAADPVKRVQLLAEAIPALSTPAGSSSIEALSPSRNYNSPVEFADKVNWPRPKANGNLIWQHSDMHDVAYIYLYKLYGRLSSLSNP
jgi:hypothetical protein